MRRIGPFVDHWASFPFVKGSLQHLDWPSMPLTRFCCSAVCWAEHMENMPVRAAWFPYGCAIADFCPF